MDYLNYPYKKGCQIVRHPVYEETQEAGNVAFAILTNVTKILRNMPEFDQFCKTNNKHWFMISWPIDCGLEEDIMKSSSDVLNFSNYLNHLKYEEEIMAGLW